MVGSLLIAGLALALFVVALIAVRSGERRRESRRRLAAQQFAETRAALAPEFLAAASATGKPRGLRWKSCELDGPILFAVDRRSDDLCALSRVTISFEAIAGGPMEDVEAVGNLRLGTAVFVHRQGRWTTDGRAVFNLDPAGTIAHFGDALDLWTPTTSS